MEPTPPDLIMSLFAVQRVTCSLAAPSAAWLILFSLGAFSMRWHIIAHSVSASASLLFVFGPFVGRMRRAPSFVRLELFAAGIAGVAWSIVGLYVYSHEADSFHTLLPWPQY
jgi:hypothetical protein